MKTKWKTIRVIKTKKRNIIVYHAIISENEHRRRLLGASEDFMIDTLIV